MPQPAFSRKLIWNCQKDGCYATQGFSKLVSLFMITWLQKNISVLDAIKRYGVTMQVARNKLHKAAIEKSLQRDKARCQKQNQLLKFATIAVKNEWMRNNLQKIVWCNSPFRTAQESWHDWQKRKLLKAKPPKQYKSTLTMLIKIRFSVAARFFQPFMKQFGQKTMIKTTCSQIVYRSRVLLLNRNLSLNLHSISISLWQEPQSPVSKIVLLPCLAGETATRLGFRRRI